MVSQFGHRGPGFKRVYNGFDIHYLKQAAEEKDERDRTFRKTDPPDQFIELCWLSV